MKYFIAILILLITTNCFATDEYDKYFRRYGKRFNIDMNIIKAQAKAESNFNHLAVSSVGAKGILQLMPGTAAETAKQLGVGDKGIFNPEFNIMLGTYYDYRMYQIFKMEKGYERIAFMLAAYNAGSSNIINAQKKAKVKDQWWAISEALPLVTGHHAKETQGYIKRIQKFYQEYTGIPFRLKSKK